MSCPDEHRPLVSVIIPLFNAASFVADTLESIAAQTYAPLEVIVVDDGSTDGSAAIARAFEARFAFFKLIALPTNSGPSVARNTGLVQASGRFVQFFDADDLMFPQKIKFSVEQLQRTKADALISTFVRFSDKRELRDHLAIGKPVEPTGRPREAVRIVLRRGFGLPSVLHRTALLRESGGLDVDLVNHEDHEFHYRLLAAGVRFLYVECPLFGYRQHDQSQRVTRQPERFEQSLRAIEKMHHLIDRLPTEHRPYARRQLGDRYAYAGANLARLGASSALLDEVFEQAKQLSSNPQVSSRWWHNALGRVFGLGTVDRVYGRLRHFFNTD